MTKKFKIGETAKVLDTKYPHNREYYVGRLVKIVDVAEDLIFTIDCITNQHLCFRPEFLEPTPYNDNA